MRVQLRGALMDIDERAEKWAREYLGMCDCPRRQDLIAAYLAGSAQTQADYAKHYATAVAVSPAEQNMNNWRDIAIREASEQDRKLRR
jgi:hypothetical protein